MLGWSISASACRSASNRAITCRRVHARLDDLERHLRAGPARSARPCRPRPCRLRRSAAGACRGRSACRVAPAAADRWSSEGPMPGGGHSRKLALSSFACKSASIRSAVAGVVTAHLSQVGLASLWRADLASDFKDRLVIKCLVMTCPDSRHAMGGLQESVRNLAPISPTKNRKFPNDPAVARPGLSRPDGLATTTWRKPSRHPQLTRKFPARRPPDGS